MARTVPDRQAARAARFNQLQITRFVNPVTQALGHSNSRNSRVVETLCYFSLMRNCGRHNFLNVPVLIEKAARQLFRSPGGSQAAHYLPGQIRINTDFAWTFISDPSTSRRLECLFAAVENLPADYNKADSAAEEKGLCEAFRHVSEVVLVRDAGRRNPNHASRELIRRVYLDIWIPHATNAFAAAAYQKDARADIPELVKDEWGNFVNFEEHCAAHGEGFHFDEQKRILERYMESLRTAPPDLRDDKMTAIEKDFKP